MSHKILRDKFQWIMLENMSQRQKPLQDKSKDEALRINKCGFSFEYFQEWVGSSEKLPSRLKLDPKKSLLHNFTYTN